MKLPQAPDKYDRRQIQTALSAIERVMQSVQRKSEDVSLVNRRLILRSPDGSLWQVEVDNTGTLSTVAM